MPKGQAPYDNTKKIRRPDGSKIGKTERKMFKRVMKEANLNQATINKAKKKKAK